MGINELGFLSPDIEVFIRNFRNKHPEEFRLADHLNQVAQRMLHSIALRSDASEPNAKYVIALMFTRALSSFQGGIILVERGMAAESRTIARSLFETAACICATANLGESFVEMLIA
jgi:hypothetical protein